MDKQNTFYFIQNMFPGNRVINKILFSCVVTKHNFGIVLKLQCEDARFHQINILSIVMSCVVYNVTFSKFWKILQVSS